LSALAQTARLDGQAATALAELVARSPIPLFCEGPLLKLARSGSNQVRWFQLYADRLAYYAEEGGDLLATVKLDLVLAIYGGGS
jgi:hypothetical protein